MKLQRNKSQHRIAAAVAVFGVVVAIAVAIVLIPGRPNTPAAPADAGVSANMAGKIVDSEGAPVAGVTVEARAGDGQPICVGVSAGDGAFALRVPVQVTISLSLRGGGAEPSVVDSLRAPLAGLRVTVRRTVAVRGTAMHDGKPISAVVWLARRSGEVVSRATAGDEGAFAFGEVPEGRYVLAGDTANYAALGMPVIADRSDPPLVQLDFGPAAPVRGRVAGPDGAGVAAVVTLHAAGDVGASRRTETGPNGAFELLAVPLGVWRADAQALGFERSEMVEVSVSHAPTSVALRLIRAAQIDVTVVDSKGKGIPDAIIRADVGFAATVAFAPGTRFIPTGELGVLDGPIPPIPTGDSAVIIARSSAETRGPAPRLMTDVRGRATILGLKPGQYTVVVRHQGYAPTRSKTVELSQGRVASVTIVATRGRAIAGRIVSRGAPVGGAMVTVVAEGLSRLTGADGRFEFGRLAGDIQISVNAASHFPLEVDVRADAAGTDALSLELEAAGATLEGIVKGPRGKPVTGAWVEYVTGTVDVRGQTDLSGKFSLTGLPPVSASIRVRHPEFSDTTFSASPPGPVSWTLPLGGAVSIQVLDGRSGAAVARSTVHLIGPASERRQVVTNRKGQARSAGLGPGAWRVRVSAAGYGVEEVGFEPMVIARRGDEGRAVRISLERGAIAAGTVRDRDGVVVAGATVQLGARRATSDAHGKFHLTQVAAGNVDLVVVRGDLSGTLSLRLAPGDEQVTLQVVID